MTKARTTLIQYTVVQRLNGREVSRVRAEFLWIVIEGNNFNFNSNIKTFLGIVTGINMKWH